MSVPLVSVVIPVYNAAATIDRALKSVMAQSFRAFEVILVDDGSTDALDAAIEPYRAEITLIRQSNRGASTARNRGVACARGDYVAFLDADDFWHACKLELQIEAFRQRPDIVMCWTGHGYWQPEEPWPDLVNAEGPATVPVFSDEFEKIFLSPYLGTPGVMMPKAVYEHVGGFREDLHSAEDIDLWLRVAHSGTTALIPFWLFHVVEMPNSLRSSHAVTTYKDNLSVIDDFCGSHPGFAKSRRSIVRRAKAKVYEEWGSAELSAGRLQFASDLLCNSLRHRMGIRAWYLLTKTTALRLRPL